MTQNLQAVQVILAEIQHAMIELLRTGKTRTIFIGATGLSEEEQVEILETLGRGDITINFTETDQPVEWYETKFRGVWIGIYKNQRNETSVYTVEICFYPAVAGSFKEDIQASAEELLEWVEAAGI